METTSSEEKPNWENCHTIGCIHNASTHCTTHEHDYCNMCTVFLHSKCYLNVNAHLFIQLTLESLEKLVNEMTTKMNERPNDTIKFKKYWNIL